MTPPLRGRAAAHRQTGPPRTKGERLPTTAQLSQTVPKGGWRKVAVDVRGHTVDRLITVRLAAAGHG